jgi:hypothetical protein
MCYLVFILKKRGFTVHTGRQNLKDKKCQTNS